MKKKEEEIKKIKLKLRSMKQLSVIVCEMQRYMRGSKQKG
jgi:hypothetical protein